MMQHARAVLLTVVLSVLFRVGYGYPGRPPVDTNSDLCATMTPGHNPPTPQNTTAPYKLVLDVNCYNPGQSVKVTLTWDLTNRTFKGFLVEARMANNSNNPNNSFGAFSIGNETEIQALNCFGKNNSAIGHNNTQKLDFTSKSFYWMGSSSDPDLELVATVVESFSAFWQGIKRQLPRCSGSGNTTSAAPTSSRINTTADARRNSLPVTIALLSAVVALFRQLQ